MPFAPRADRREFLGSLALCTVVSLSASTLLTRHPNLIVESVRHRVEPGDIATFEIDVFNAGRESMTLGCLPLCKCAVMVSEAKMALEPGRRGMFIVSVNWRKSPRGRVTDVLIQGSSGQRVYQSLRG